MPAPGFTYQYNASALGLGGVLKNSNGATTIVPSLASVALAPTGGEGSCEVLNYDKDGVSFSSARSSVVGYDSEYRTFTTCSDIYITNLNLFGRVKVAILHTNVTSTRDVLTNDIITESNPDNALFTMQAMIRGLTIDGVEVVPAFDLDLCECRTYYDFTARIGGTGVGTYASRFGIEQTELQTVLATGAQPIRASFVSDLQHAPADTLGPRQGFKLPVKNFGDVHFGELVVKPGRRRVNLLRFDFDSTLLIDELEAMEGEALESVDESSGSPFQGTMTVLSQDSNGAPCWP